MRVGSLESRAARPPETDRSGSISCPRSSEARRCERSVPGASGTVINTAIRRSSADAVHQPEQLLALDDVQARGRLVGEQQPRLANERVCELDARAVASRQLVPGQPDHIRRGDALERSPRRADGPPACRRAASAAGRPDRAPSSRAALRGRARRSRPHLPATCAARGATAVQDRSRRTAPAPGPAPRPRRRCAAASSCRSSPLPRSRRSAPCPASARRRRAQPAIALRAGSACSRAGARAAPSGTSQGAIRLVEQPLHRLTDATQPLDRRLQIGDLGVSDHDRGDRLPGLDLAHELFELQLAGVLLEALEAGPFLLDGDLDQSRQMPLARQRELEVQLLAQRRPQRRATASRPRTPPRPLSSPRTSPAALRGACGACRLARHRRACGARVPRAGGCRARRRSRPRSAASPVRPGPQSGARGRSRSPGARPKAPERPASETSSRRRAGPVRHRHECM